MADKLATNKWLNGFLNASVYKGTPIFKTLKLTYSGNIASLTFRISTTSYSYTNNASMTTGNYITIYNPTYTWAKRVTISNKIYDVYFLDITYTPNASTHTSYSPSNSMWSLLSIITTQFSAIYVPISIYSDYQVDSTNNIYDIRGLSAGIQAVNNILMNKWIINSTSSIITVYSTIYQCYSGANAENIGNCLNTVKRFIHNNTTYWASAYISVGASGSQKIQTNLSNLRFCFDKDTLLNPDYGGSKIWYDTYLFGSSPGGQLTYGYENSSSVILPNGYAMAGYTGLLDSNSLRCLTEPEYENTLFTRYVIPFVGTLVTSNNSYNYRPKYYDNDFTSLAPSISETAGYGNISSSTSIEKIIPPTLSGIDCLLGIKAEIQQNSILFSDEGSGAAANDIDAALGNWPSYLSYASSLDTTDNYITSGYYYLNNVMFTPTPAVSRASTIFAGFSPTIIASKSTYCTGVNTLFTDLKTTEGTTANFSQYKFTASYGTTLYPVYNDIIRPTITPGFYPSDLSHTQAEFTPKLKVRYLTNTEVLNLYYHPTVPSTKLYSNTSSIAGTVTAPGIPVYKVPSLLCPGGTRYSTSTARIDKAPSSYQSSYTTYTLFKFLITIGHNASSGLALRDFAYNSILANNPYLTHDDLSKNQISTIVNKINEAITDDPTTITATYQIGYVASSGVMGNVVNITIPVGNLFTATCTSTTGKINIIFVKNPSTTKCASGSTTGTAFVTVSAGVVTKSNSTPSMPSLTTRNIYLNHLGSLTSHIVVSNSTTNRTSINNTSTPVVICS